MSGLSVKFSANTASKAASEKAANLKISIDALTGKAKLGTLGTEDLVGLGRWGAEGQLPASQKTPLAQSLEARWAGYELDGDNLGDSVILNAPWGKSCDSNPTRQGTGCA